MMPLPHPIPELVESRVRSGSKAERCDNQVSRKREARHTDIVSRWRPGDVPQVQDSKGLIHEEEEYLYPVSTCGYMT